MVLDTDQSFNLITFSWTKAYASKFYIIFFKSLDNYAKTPMIT